MYYKKLNSGQLIIRIMILRIYIQILLNDILAIVKRILFKKEWKKTNWKNLKKIKIERNILMEIIFEYIYYLIDFNKYVIVLSQTID